jgi:hypothetical protein
MRSVLARRAKTVADEALLRVQALAGGAGGGVLPNASLTLNVSKGGNDATGDGTDERPYLTIGKALAVAPTYSPTFANPALILVGPGAYVENLVMPPFVWVAGFEAGNTVTVGTGAGSSISLAPSWLADTSGFTVGGVESVITAGDVTINFTGAASFGEFVFGQPVVFGGALSVIGDPVNGGDVYLPPGTILGAPVSISGASFISQGVEYGTGSPISIVSTAAQPAVWNSQGDVVQSSVTVDSTAGMPVTATVSSGCTGPLHLNGAGTSYSATAGGVPPVITLAGGAPPPILLTDAHGIGYTPAVPGNWVAPPPTTEQEAFDRIAANTTNAHPIP